MIAKVAIVLTFLPMPLSAQETPDEAAAGVRDAWLVQDVDNLLNGPDPVTLSLPGAESTRPLSPAQAAALLRDFFKNTEEVSFSLRRVGTVSDDQGYVEADRSFVITGTTEVLNQRVLVGFQRNRRIWLVSEIRVRQLSGVGR